MFCKNCGEKTEENNKLCLDCKPAENSEDEASSNAGLFKGRIGRLRYFLYTAYIAIASAIFFKITIGAFGTDSLPSILSISNIFSVLAIPLNAKRLRDISWPGYTAIILYVLGLFFGLSIIWLPIALIWGLVLLFKKGDPGENKYGYPENDGKSLKPIVYGLLALFIFAIIGLTILPLIFE